MQTAIILQFCSFHQNLSYVSTLVLPKPQENTGGHAPFSNKSYLMLKIQIKIADIKQFKKTGFLQALLQLGSLDLQPSIANTDLIANALSAWQITP